MVGGDVRLNPEEKQRPELCCHSVIMLSLFRDDATLVGPHCQTRFHQQQLIRNDSFAILMRYAS